MPKTLSGEEREMRMEDDGFVVRLRNGATLTADANTLGAGDDLSFCESMPWFSRQMECCGWQHSGESTDGDSDLDIVAILGPAKVDHGDGTETRLVTIPVTATDRRWETCDLVRGREDQIEWATKQPTPDPYVAMLVAAVRADQVEIPKRAKWWTVDTDECMKVWESGDPPTLDFGDWKGHTESAFVEGLLCDKQFKLDPGIIIDLDKVRRLLEEGA